MDNIDIFLELKTWLSANSLGWLYDSFFTLSLGANWYLYKKFRESNKSEEWYINLLRDIEPLLAKIISKDKFNNADIEDAKEIRNIIKSKIRKDDK
jgi:hypothetical protein